MSAHTELDLANPKPNRGKKGFTDEERAGFQAFVDAGFVDTFRLFTQGNGHYSWWSHFANSRARNVGWRIDYIMVSEKLRKAVKKSEIHTKVMGSDHCPVSITLDVAAKMTGHETFPDTVAAEDEFELFDLRVDVVAPKDSMIYCGAKPGDYFELHGEMLILPPGQGFSIYSLAALLPLLPAKQRVSDKNDWMSSDAEVACPDPNCPTRFRISRTRKRRFKHSETTAVPIGQARDT